MNTISITGRLGQEPELKKTESNIPVCTFSVAVKRPHAKDTTDWINCVAWRQSAEFLCRYGHKGSFVALSGYLGSRKWTDKNGQERTVYEITVDALEMPTESNSSEPKQTPTKSEKYSQASNSPYSRQSDDGFAEMTSDDELPF